MSGPGMICGSWRIPTSNIIEDYIAVSKALLVAGNFSSREFPIEADSAFALILPAL
jgi:hypothetical protein